MYLESLSTTKTSLKQLTTECLHSHYTQHPIFYIHQTKQRMDQSRCMRVVGSLLLFSVFPSIINANDLDFDLWKVFTNGKSIRKSTPKLT